jgi:hypothetical protein
VDQEEVLGLTLASIAVGLALALAYHLLALRLQSRLARRASPAAPLFAILGFVVRLAVFAAVLIMLGLWTPLSIMVVGVAFVCLFTILNGWTLYNLLVRRKGAPPSAGAGA